MNEALTIATAIAEEIEAAVATNYQNMIAHIAEAESGLAEVKSIIDRAEDSIARMKDAAQALKPPKASKKKARAKSKAAKPPVTKEVAQPVCLTFVKENPGINLKTLKGLVKQKLTKENNYQESGAALQIDYCLKSDLFTIATDGSVSIAQATAPTALESDTNIRTHANQ